MTILSQPSIKTHENNFQIIDPAGNVLFEKTLSIAEVKIVEVLFSSHGNVVEKDRLISVGWSGKPVSSSALTVAMSNIRHALKDTGIEIKNVPRLGYIMNIESLTITELLTKEYPILEGYSLDEKTPKGKIQIAPFFTKRPNCKSLSKKATWLLFFTAAAIVSTLIAYFDNTQSAVCTVDNNYISCLSSDPDFNISPMSLDVNTESFLIDLKGTSKNENI